MRAVNLLPRQHVEQKRERPNAVVLVAAIGGAAVVLALVAGTLVASRSVNRQQQALATARAVLAVTPAHHVSATTQAFRQQVLTQREQRSLALASALCKRVAWDRILRRFALVLPNDVWLTGLTATVPLDPAPVTPTTTPSALPAAATELNIAGLHLLPGERRAASRAALGRPGPAERPAPEQHLVERLRPERHQLHDRRRHPERKGGLVTARLASLPKAAQVALVATVLLLVALIGYFTLIAPKQLLGRQPEAADGRRAGSDQQQQLVGVHAGAAGGSLRQRLQRHAGDAEQARHARRAHLAQPAGVRLRDLVRPDHACGSRSTTSTSAASGVPATTSTDPFAVEPIQAKFTGSFYDLLSFLQRMRNLVRVQNGRLFTAGRLFDVSSVTLAEGPKRLAAGLGDARRSTSSCRRRVAAPTTPSTTDTTSTTHVHDDHHLGLHVGGSEHERRDFMNRKQQKRMEDLRTAKDKKMKKVAAGLSVVLAVVLAFEVPSMLKSSGGGSATPPAATTDASPASRPRLPAPRRRLRPAPPRPQVTPVASANTVLPNSDTLPKVGKSQLYSFSHFAEQGSVRPAGRRRDARPADGGGSTTSSSSTSASTSRLRPRPPP